MAARCWGAYWKGRNRRAQPLARTVSRVELEAHRSREEVDGLVLLAVVLPAERVPTGHVQDLPDVALGVGPDELVAPGLLDAPRIEPDVLPRERSRALDRRGHGSSFPVEDRHRAPARQPGGGSPRAFRPSFPRASLPGPA